MTTGLTTDNIKYRIARILMGSPVGLMRKSITVQIGAEPDQINSIIAEMAGYDHLKIDGNRIKITAIGRAHYAGTIGSQPAKSSNTTPPIAPPPQPHPEEYVADDIEPISCYRTRDGIIHLSEQDAKSHLFMLDMHPEIERFMSETGVKKHSRGIAKKFVLDYERWRQEQTA